jgi:hypothetical protein
VISFFCELWSGDWDYKLLVILCAALAAFVAWLMYIGVYYAVDSLYVVPQPWLATVIDHKHTAAWIQTIPCGNGKTSWVQVINHPESWELVMVLDDGRTITFGVGEEDWRSVEKGRKVNVMVKEGRLSGGAYVVTADL